MPEPQSLDFPTRRPGVVIAGFKVEHNHAHRHSGLGYAPCRARCGLHIHPSRGGLRHQLNTDATNRF